MSNINNIDYNNNKVNTILLFLEANFYTEKCILREG